METAGPILLNWAVNAAIALNTIGMLLTLVRLLRGPTLPDRVVALDLIATLSVGLIAALDIYLEQPSLLDASIIVALLAFLGTVAFASYLGRRAQQ